MVAVLALIEPEVRRIVELVTSHEVRIGRATVPPTGTHRKEICSLPQFMSCGQVPQLSTLPQPSLG
jgi:hypothetical protein